MSKLRLAKMGRKCNVLDCPSDSKRSEDNGVTFHKMPFHPDLRPKWIELCRIPEDRQLNKVIYVCSRHFRRTDFCNFKGTKYMLKQGALPSVFPWTKCLIKMPNGSKSDDATNSDSTDIKLEPMDMDSKSNDEIDISNIKEEPMDEEEEVVPELVEEEKIPKIKKETTDISIKPKSKKEKKEVVVKKECDAPSSIAPPKNRDDIQICISFFPGTRIEANDFNDKWYPASILEVDYEENEVFVEFDKHLNRANEWIPMDSSRLRPYVGAGTADFVVGEKCMATWMNSCSKYPATIKKVLDGDNYEVLFDDGFTKILKHCKLSKIKDPNNIPLPPKAPVPHAAPLFEPVVGSKEDRRERKRKINVAQLFGRKKSKSDDPYMRYDDDEKYDIPELKSIPPLAYGDGEEWTCRWLNGEPIGLESTLESPDGTRRSIIVPDHRLPPGWEKHLTQRLHGNSAGKWDSILVNPDGKKFANRQQLKVWFEDNKLDYNIENFDFSLHVNRAKKLGLYEITDPELTAANLKPNQQQKSSFPKLKGANKSQNSKSAASKNAAIMAQSPATPDIPVLEPEVEEDNNPEVSLKIIHENDSYKCPIEGCGKNFRKENLAQMHIKHYHPEYSKLIGSTPNVADLAYARTVGEHIDEIVPPKLKPIASPLIDKEKSLKAESTSKPKSTIKVLTPKTVSKEDKSIERIPNLSGPSPSLANQTKSNSKDSEIIRLLNSEPKTKMDSIFDSVEIHKQLAADEPKPTPDRYPEIKLRDLLTKSEPIPYKKDEFNRTFGIKTLLPVNRRNSDDIKNDTETDLKSTERNKIGKKRQSADKRRQSFKYDDTDDMSDYGEADSHSQDSFKIKTPVEMIAAPPLQEGQVIIEGGEVIRLVHMRSEEIINCTCGITEEDGLMIQCELCLCWQHAHCNNIAKENEVPDKYVCKICKNPQRMRQSKKYIHDQDWLKQGVLATANYHSKDAKVLEKRFEMLRKSHELSGCMVELNEYLHNLRVKLNIAGSKDHPKLYLWAKPWDKPLPNNTLNLQKPESKDDDDIKEESFNRSFASSDHSYIKSTTAFSEMALKTMLEPLEDLKNEIENPDLDMDIKLPVDTKIKSQSELISILEDDEPCTSTTDVNKMDSDENSSFPKIDLNSMIVNNLGDKIESKDEVFNKEEALNSITSGILSTTSLDLALAQLSGVVAAPEVGASHLLIPQPEAVIDSSDCKLNLLDHVAHYQSLIEERLNSVEAVLFELEGEDSNPLPEDDDNDSKTKQTLQMLMRDLGTMREIAAINN